MRADSLQMQEVFSSGGKVHYVLPHFQREYAWEEGEWRTLITDIFNVYSVYDQQKPPEHFMGALVVINDGTQAGTVPVFRLVDGQQRLTTISLLLHAFHQLLDPEEHEELCHELYEMLTNRFKKGPLRYKLLPTIKYGDRESYCSIIDNKELPEGIESNIPAAYDYLYKQLRTRMTNGGLDPQRLFAVLMTCLQVVFINLNNSERPYEIFESLNYKGKSLTQADLVRNYIAMKLPPGRQETVFTELWSPIEETLLEKRTVGRSRLGELTAFLRHYFAYTSGVLINQDHVYSRFRDLGEKLSADEFEAELAKLKRMAQYYDRLLRPSHNRDLALRRQLERLNRLESSTAYPFLLHLYDLRSREEISRDDMLEALRSLECYLVRRFLARESTNYNRLFPLLVKEVDPSRLVESVHKALGEKREPSDTRLRQSAERVSLYRNSQYVRQRLILVLETIDHYLSKDRGGYSVLDDDATIEHIMPQTLSLAWKTHLGTTWEQDFESLHTLGNLTLVTQEWNSSLSNAPYEVKSSKLAEHALRLNNEYFGEHAPASWSGEAISQRGQWLMALALEIWPQLGETAAGLDEVPREVVILGESMPVSSWRDVLRRTADFVAHLLYREEFEAKIVTALPSYFAREPIRSASHLLPNGWYLAVNHSADWIRHLCETIVEAAEIPEEEFEIGLW